MKKTIKYLTVLAVLFLIPIFSAKAASSDINTFCQYDYCRMEQDKSSECITQCVQEVEVNCGTHCDPSDGKCMDACIYALDRADCQSLSCLRNAINEFVDDYYDNNSPLTCDDVKHVTQAYTAIRILAPFLLIIFGSIDFLKAVMAGDEKKQREARSKFPKRLIAFLLLIILPFIISFLVTTFGTYGSQNTSLFCCIVSNGNSACSFEMSYTPQEDNTGSGGNNSNNNSDNNNNNQKPDEEDSDWWDKTDENNSNSNSNSNNNNNNQKPDEEDSDWWDKTDSNN